MPILSAALLLPLALVAAGVPLARATRPMVEVTRGEESYLLEEGIAPDDGGAIHAYLKRLGESHPEIVRVPGQPGLFLASDFAGGTGERFQRHLVLLRSTRAGVEELSGTRPVTGARSLTPVVFVGGGRTFVLAEPRAEYSWGLRVYEIVGATLRELGAIDAGVPGELGEEDPMPFARLRLEGGVLVVQFDTDLALGTGRKDAPVARKPVVFRQGEAGFVRVEGAGKPRR